MLASRPPYQLGTIKNSKVHVGPAVVPRANRGRQEPVSALGQHEREIDATGGSGDLGVDLDGPRGASALGIICLANGVLIRAAR